MSNLLSALWMQYRAGRLLKRMEGLNELYAAAVERGDKHAASFIDEDVHALDQQLSELLDRWEADVASRKAVRP
jgi:hypothetical protein